jgi:hypothetical protein
MQCAGIETTIHVFEVLDALIDRGPPSIIRLLLCLRHCFEALLQRIKLRFKLRLNRALGFLHFRSNKFMQWRFDLLTDVASDSVSVHLLLEPADTLFNRDPPLIIVHVAALI